MVSALTVPVVTTEALVVVTVATTGHFLPRVYVPVSGVPPHTVFRSLFKTTARGSHAGDPQTTASDPPLAF